MPVRLDVSRTTGNGYALRLRFEATLRGPCMRCLEPAAPRFDVDAREVEQPGRRRGAAVPYVVDDGELDLAAWARDALALALPAQITCRPDCAGLCPQCGANLNEDPEHAHEAAPDPRWAKLSEIRFDCAAVAWRPATSRRRPRRRCPARSSASSTPTGLAARRPRTVALHPSSPPMAVPKQKQSHSRTTKRRSQHKITAPSINACPQCRQPRRPHRVCPHCGFYGGREVVRPRHDHDHDHDH